MLARTILTAEELQITSLEHEKLLLVRDMLARGELEYDDQSWSLGFKNKRGLGFNMKTWTGIGFCGTVHCIGGWMDSLGAWGDRKDNLPCVGLMGVSPRLHRLFFPEGRRGHNPYMASVVQAVSAIDGFLAGVPAGEAWVQAMIAD